MAIGNRIVITNIHRTYRAEWKKKIGSNWKINMHKFPFQFVRISNIGYDTIKSLNNRHQREFFVMCSF